MDELTVEVTPDGGTRNGVRVAFDRVSTSEPAGPPPAARRFVFLFDEALRFRPEAFPTCDRATVEERGVAACPPDSVIGGGTGHLHPDDAQDPEATTVDVYVLNARHDNGLRGALVAIPEIGSLLELTWEPVTRAYRERGYRWALDEILPPSDTPPEERLGTVRFEIDFGATRQVRGRAVSFAETTGRAGGHPAAALRFGQWAEFVTGQIGLTETLARLRPRS
ncbi:hypothetical protein D7319_15925 [Streptomyces radicis]|uniref:Uncharacterized protein n=1 Tax=Streptomyces radicis TaxID=1750517 RepID=A0A3A9W5E4_9ACTN|nr:hypothetical protein D7319_15925 [Streptomyces radicis]RKN21647.1 hypothetical protein D7318_16515 [Streptomyces radicis]